MKIITCDWLNWLTKTLKTLKLNIDGSKLKLPYLEDENNNTWLTKLIN